MTIDKKGIASFDFSTSGDFKGICAACIKTPELTEIWPKKKTGNGMYAKELSPVELVSVAHALIEANEEYQLVGWGTLGYDLRHLYKEGVMKDEIISLALSHYDLMFQIFADSGQMVALHSLHGVKPTINKSIPPQTPQLWIKDADSQIVVIESMEAHTERVFMAARTLQLNTPLHWTDYNSSSNEIQYKNMLSPCLEYILPASMLPQKILNQKWVTTFDWIREHLQPKQPGKNKNDLTWTQKMIANLDSSLFSGTPVGLNTMPAIPF